MSETMKLASSSDHAPLPKRGSCIRADDGSPADLLNTGDYPITAVCAVCEGRIKTLTFFSSTWNHVRPSPQGHEETEDQGREM
jgi:hypothetical protein